MTTIHITGEKATWYVEGERHRRRTIEERPPLEVE
jgi:hypothetical protein